VGRAFIALRDGGVSFSPGRLQAALATALAGVAEAPTGLCVALSGGLDSTVLLTVLAGLRADGIAPPVRALHVDHGLHADSALWSQHSVELAKKLGVECAVRRVHAAPAHGESPESAARAARYTSLRAELTTGEVLLTAHHADDQLEGVLLQWLRGGGLRALAGMPPLARFGPGWHARPMLGFTRREIEDWAREQRLSWLEDPSNADCALDRNYLRHEVLPALRKRWPAAPRTVARVAEQAAEALELQRLDAAAELAEIAAGVTLPLDPVRSMTLPRQRRLLREWLRIQGLPLPAAATLEALRRNMLEAAADRVPETRWPGAAVRRYRDHLYAEPVATTGHALWHAGAWPEGRAFELGALGRLEWRPASGPGVDLAKLAAPLRVEPRPMGACFRPAGSAHRRELRKWLQERGVLPWRRVDLPVVTLRGEVVAVAGLGYGAHFVAGPGDSAWHLDWIGRPVLTESEALSAPLARPTGAGPS
jgi:tRNA(Ile)-lysidine synthase